jgi:hypothetical protein
MIAAPGSSPFVAIVTTVRGLTHRISEAPYLFTRSFVWLLLINAYRLICMTLGVLLHSISHLFVICSVFSSRGYMLFVVLYLSLDFSLSFVQVFGGPDLD